jgi:hypothetical protein
MKRVEIDLPISNGLMVRVKGHLDDNHGLSVVYHKRPTESSMQNADAWTASEYHTGMELLSLGDTKLRRDNDSKAKVVAIIKKKITETNVQKYIDAVNNNKDKWVNK